MTLCRVWGSCLRNQGIVHRLRLVLNLKLSHAPMINFKQNYTLYRIGRMRQSLPRSIQYCSRTALLSYCNFNDPPHLFQLRTAVVKFVYPNLTPPRLIKLINSNFYIAQLNQPRLSSLVDRIKVPTQTITTPLHNSTRFSSSFEFEGKLFHWLIGVKCQNLCHLNLPFVSFNLSFYFNPLCHFQIHYALYHQLVVIASPLHSHHSVQLLFPSHPLSTLTCQHSPRFVQLPLPFSLFPTHLFTPTPLSYQHTLQSFSFSLDVFHSLPANHTNQNSASITQIIVSFGTTIIMSTFSQNCHSFSHFDSTSTHINVADLLICAPHFLISTLII